MTSEGVVRVIAALGFVAVSLLIFYGLLFHAVPKDNKEMLTAAFAFIGGLVASPLLTGALPKRPRG